MREALGYRKEELARSGSVTLPSPHVVDSVRQVVSARGWNSSALLPLPNNGQKKKNPSQFPLRILRRTSLAARPVDAPGQSIRRLPELFFRLGWQTLLICYACMKWPPRKFGATGQLASSQRLSDPTIFPFQGSPAVPPNHNVVSRVFDPTLEAGLGTRKMLLE